jgi:hypothetical protein
MSPFLDIALKNSKFLEFSCSKLVDTEKDVIRQILLCILILLIYENK